VSGGPSGTDPANGAMQQAAQALLSARTVVIGSHVDPYGDAIGSTL
jgi:nanoRNase/pAp phosphatase (c-di-AMP/oligoRNAs hydrolase)